MMYPFLTLDDDTEVTHSEMYPDGSVKIYIETPDEVDGFHNATCYLPAYRWENVHGYSAEEFARLERLVRNNAHLILEFSRKGGVLHAANFFHSSPILPYFPSLFNPPLLIVRWWDSVPQTP